MFVRGQEFARKQNNTESHRCHHIRHFLVLVRVRQSQFWVDGELTEANDCLARIPIELCGPAIHQFHKKGIALVRRFNLLVHFRDA